MSKINSHNLKSLFRFQKKYFLLGVFIFGIEVLIAVYIQDGFIRPYLGDFLVVILLYCLIKSFIDIPVLSLSISVLLFSYMVEILQYFNFVQLIGLEDSRLANIIIGNSFARKDLLAYTFGILLVLWLEWRK
ncbi:MAG: DUF2809 domain-containing protein [Bacteroidetes bacterium]|nr:DUF2809 domain-containing protein [Bacteroidota bacterium]